MKPNTSTQQLSIIQLSQTVMKAIEGKAVLLAKAICQIKNREKSHKEMRKWQEKMAQEMIR